MTIAAIHQVEVSAPSRLHFGLLSIGDRMGSGCGGAGVMIQSPRVCVYVRPDTDFVVRYGPLARRVAHIVQAWSRRRLQRKQPNVFVDVRSQIAAHTGLGSGTQLSLALARALNQCYELDEGEPADLAASVDRGQRSAVGTHGFLGGGMIVESGNLDGKLIASVSERVPIPKHWRFLLIRVGDMCGRSGAAEQAAFARLPTVAAEVSEQLWRELVDCAVPAARQDNLDEFGEHIYRYGCLSGNCFAAAQGGPFASPAIAAVVDALRAMGIRGVGQSSWGPTVFAITASERDAETAWQQLRQQHVGEPLYCSIAKPDNLGAVTTIDGRRQE